MKSKIQTVQLKLLNWTPILALLLLFVVFFGFGQSEPGNQAKGRVFLDVEVLKDLDTGDIASARQRLNDDCMVQVFTELENLNFTTNSEILANSPALRAAAKYWSNKPLPGKLPIFPMDDPNVSNRIYRAMQIVQKRMEEPKSKTH